MGEKLLSFARVEILYVHVCHMFFCVSFLWK